MRKFCLFFLVLNSIYCGAQINFSDVKEKDSQSVDDAKIYITPHVGAGFGFGSFSVFRKAEKDYLDRQLNDRYVDANFSTFVLPIGIDGLFKVSNIFKLGGGLRQTSFSGTYNIYETLNNSSGDFNARILFLYLASEIIFLNSKKGEMGLSMQIGPPLMTTDFLDNKAMYYANLGYVYNARIAKNLWFNFGLTFNFTGLQNKFAGTEVRTMFDYAALIGLRIGI